jgi:hypothetical protein
MYVHECEMTSPEFLGTRSGIEAIKKHQQNESIHRTQIYVEEEIEICYSFGKSHFIRTLIICLSCSLLYQRRIIIFL